MSLVTKGYGGKQLLLFGYGESYGASADCLQARQICEITATVQEISLPSGGYVWFYKEEIKELPVFYATVDAFQQKQICDTEASLVFTYSAAGSQKKQACRSAAKNIPISDEDILTLLLAA